MEPSEPNSIDASLHIPLQQTTLKYDHTSPEAWEPMIETGRVDSPTTVS
jgi:hypothetical protein